MTGKNDNARLIDVELDETIGQSTPDIEHERAVAIFDLIEENSFSPVGDQEGGPYRLRLSLVEKRLIFTITRETGDQVATHILAVAIAQNSERLFSDLRKLLCGHPLGNAEPDRGD